MNRLAKESSPYLLQHAHHLVDWYPWGEEAFQAAVSQDKPIFLSIGYSTCHWCHVMERESFSNAEVAALMNDFFINIKVDKEEHPEVDSIYMEFAQILMTSGGGWPLNLILTPSLKPFFAVTYLPLRAVGGLPGFIDVVQGLGKVWKSEEKKMFVEEAEKLTEIFAKTSNATGHSLPTPATLQEAFDRFFEIADPLNGGIKGIPKFPLSYQIEYLLQSVKETQDARVLYYVELSLQNMYRGGIYDHLGGGFCRYSIDEEWKIPHFEKMLYDNALLAKAYLQAWKMTKKPLYKTICQEILDYLLREMASLEGGFFAAEDAESQNIEGLFYTWTPGEIEKILSSEESELFCALFDVTHVGNFEGRNVLHLDVSLKEFAESMNLSLADWEEKVQHWKERLLEERLKRPKPFKDETILTSWNALAIEVFARAGSSFNEKKYTEAALKGAQFIKTNLWKEGSLFHQWRKGEARFPAVLEDYTFLIRALLSLFEEGEGFPFLEWALTLTKIVEKEFKEIEGACYQTDGKESLILRKCEFYDGAEPSGNGVHAENLLRLYQLVREDSFLIQAEDLLKAAKNYIDLFAPGTCYQLIACQRYCDPLSSVVVIALNDKEEHKAEIRQALATKFLPNCAVIWKKKSDKEGIEIPIQNQTTLYICRKKGCESPLTKLEEIVKVIEAL